MTASLEDLAALRDAQCRIHPEAQALDQSREVPRINPHSIDGRLPSDGVEPRPMEKCWPERVIGQRLVEPCHGAGRMCDRGCHGR
jgi:hypothetical protein